VSFSYDNTLADNVSKVRFNLADKNSAAYVFEDEEITATVTAQGTVADATVALILVLIADRARRTKKFAVEGLSLDDTAQIAALKDLLSLYGGGLPTFAVIDPARLPMDEGYVEITT